LLPAFADIQNDPERYDIEILASIWLVHEMEMENIIPKIMFAVVIL
jgi:hypothetical protein